MILKFQEREGETTFFMEQSASICIRGYRKEEPENCKNIATRGSKKEEPCKKDIVENKCSEHKLKEDHTLINIGTLGKLCRELNIRDFHKEVHRRYPDKCYDFTATVAYLARLKAVPSNCYISVINKNTIKLKCDRFPNMLYEFGNWDEVCNFNVFKNPKISDIEALLAVILELTYQGWTDGYYQWLNINIDNITVGRFNEIVRKKTGL